MKKLVISIIVCLAAIASMAQTKSEILVSYNNITPNKYNKLVTSKMLLLASSTDAKYFNELSLWVDSLKSTPEGKAKYMDILKKACMTVEPDGSNSWNLSKGPVKRHTCMYSVILPNKRLLCMTSTEKTWAITLSRYQK